jgi:hypothetical protein
MPDGIFNLNKPRGPTSHDIVDRVRALTGIRRVGHAGTLDPLASGVLLVCIGRATRVSEYLMAGQKVYRARVRLGITTDTYDAEGQVVAEAPVEVSISGARSPRCHRRTRPSSMRVRRFIGSPVEASEWSNFPFSRRVRWRSLDWS